MRFPPSAIGWEKPKIVENCHETATKTKNFEAGKKYFYRLFHRSNLYSQINTKNIREPENHLAKFLALNALQKAEKYLNRIIFN